jgi:acetylornithine deacetylase
VEKFQPIFAALRELEARRHADPDPLFARWDLAFPLEIGMVRAGDWASSVPGELIAEGRIGVALGEPPERARDALEETVARVCAADPWLAAHPVTVEWWGGRFAPARTTDAGFLAAVTDAAGEGTERWAAPYGSDLRLLTAAGIPTVQYGPGDVDLAHAPDEHVSLAEVGEAARTLTRLATRYCA